MLTILAITNASAGSSNDAAVEAAVTVMQQANDVEVLTTESPADLDDALSERPDIDVVVALGGDGSLHAVVGALHRAGRLDQVVVGLIPLGTGNDLARTFGLPTDPEQAARVVIDGRTADVELGHTDHDVTVNAVHLGVGVAAAQAGAAWKKRLGPLGYLVGAVRTGFVTPGERLTVVVDGEEVAHGHHVLQVAAGVGRYVGAGTPLLPDADPGDGRFDITISFAGPWYRRLLYAWHVRSGKQELLDDVTMLRGREITVTGPELSANNDGELGDPVAEHHWTIEPAAWRLRVPR